MTAWQFSSPRAQFILLFAMFIVVCFQIFYLIWTFERRKKAAWIAETLWTAVMFAVFSLLTCGDKLNTVPLFSLWLITVITAVLMIILTVYSAKKDKNRITKASIKEAMDDLPLAGCYFTDRGTVKLCNRQMYRLYHAMTGRDLQTLSELKSALENCDENGIVKTHDGGYVFPDGRVWFYFEHDVISKYGRHYTESILSDATELSKANAELVRDNAELERINAKLGKMYLRAEDRIREREYLAFKMKIHDDIGSSLAVIRKVLLGEIPDGDLEKQIATLSVAAGTLVYSPKSDSDDPYDILLNRAAELGVDIRLDGMLPIEPLIYELVVKAISECLTNCVRHAHGSAVFVRIAGLPGGYSVTVTNDGEKPNGRIKEGGGLSTLRKSIENAGGEMTVSHYPEFVLKLTLMREEMEL